ncbi:hypothetical protein FAI41_03910 [Acetobacteraceae bacterium]|nr:hypothetical protein FAI41_03910 [Acetobacteraceae bacterium]
MNKPLDNTDEAQNPLKELIEGLRDGEVIHLRDYRNVYQSWTIKKLRELLKAEAFQPDEILKLAQNYWLLAFDGGAAGHAKESVRDILKADWDIYSASAENLERLHVLQKLAQILHPILKKYWERKRILDSELEVILEDSEQYPWEILIKAKISESKETKTDKENPHK